MFCPKCKDEYQDGFIFCNDCEEHLVENLPVEADAFFVTDDSLVFLCTLYDHMEVAMVEALMKSNSIPVIKKLRSGGDINMLYMGATSTDTDLYVPSKLLEHAKELLIPNPDDIIIIEAEDDYGESKDEYANKRRTRARWLFLLYIGIPIAAILATYVLGILNSL